MKQQLELTNVYDRLKELLQTLADAAEEIWLLLAQGETRRGMRGLSDFILGLNEAQKAIDYLEGYNSLYRENTTERRRRLEETYPAILSAVEEQDFVAIGDLLRFELGPALQDYRESIEDGGGGGVSGVDH